jgi:hypothetical protein
MSTETDGTSRERFWSTYHRNAMRMGVVKQEVNKSAGSSGFIGRISFLPQAASWMQFLNRSDGGMD